jgi:DNA mismatch repair protein MutL
LSWTEKTPKAEANSGNRSRRREAAVYRTSAIIEGGKLTKRITVLSEETANQIAAGEVVERPASIVKEMVENSIDADATDIRIELEAGGCKSITVTDNGSGIGREDVALVFERHATSKISNLEDIYRTVSYGFRGEAMPSIASVALVEMTTRRADDLEGTKAVVRGGVISEVTPAGAPAGTRIRVSELFANVPARRKFLKTEATEQSACMDALTRIALARPDVRFVVMADGREVFTTPAVKDIRERIAVVMGSNFQDQSLAVSGETERVSLAGFISAPSFTRSNSRGIYLFVNGRFVRDNSITHALLAAYRQVIEPRRYPAAVLFLNLPGDEVDINVHPAKLEVRFRNAGDIYSLISKSVAGSLAGDQATEALGPSFAYRLAPREKTSASSGYWKPKGGSAGGAVPYGLFSRQNLERAISQDQFTRVADAGGPYIAANKAESPAQQVNLEGYEYLGQFAGSYLAFGGPDGLMMIDQHAAHERIILERLKASSAKRAATQPLLVPEVVTVAPAQIALLEAALPLLDGLGIELEIYGRDAVALKALPACMPHIPAEEIVSDLADQLQDGNLLQPLEQRREKIMASLACRAAVKARTVLLPEEVASLCRDLAATPFNATCPHGRPVSVRFPLSEIERMFKRK